MEITAIDGMAGIGKTAFAIHVAHQLAPRFPDGQLFLRLYGHTPGHRPVEPSDALSTLLLTDGVPPRQIPPGIDARAALWRDRMARKKVLLLLDDATGSDQVKPLLPGGAGTLVLITSRRRLTALPEALPITLDVLEANQAESLFVQLAGLKTRDDDVANIVRLCGYLPLAISLIAGNLRHHQAWTPADMSDELDSVMERLESMRAEDDSVTVAFDLSYRDLTTDQKQMFRRLGLHPGGDFDAHAAAALDDVDLTVAHRLLDGLFACHVVDEPTRGRYRFHDLIREHARFQARDDDTGDRDAAIARVIAYYLDTAWAADLHLARHIHGTGHVASDTVRLGIPRFSTRDEAASWMTAERLNLHAAADYAARHDRPGVAIAIAAAMHGFLRAHGHWDQALVLHKTSVNETRRIHDRASEADALHDLGEVQRLMGDFPAAAASQARALELYRELRNRRGEANALNDLGFVQRRIGDYPAAAASLYQALELYNLLSDRRGEAHALNYLGDVQRLTGDYSAAAASQARALGLFRDLGDRIGEANVLTSQGEALRLLGDYEAATASLNSSLTLCRDLGNRNGEANALNYLGDVQRLTGDYPAAAVTQEKALALYRDLGNRNGEANALNYLGEVQRLAGDYMAATESQKLALKIHRELGNRHGEARTLISTGELSLVSSDLANAHDRFRESLYIARDIVAPHEEAEALEGLGRCQLHSGQSVQATDLLRQALAIYRRISSPCASRVEDVFRDR